MTNKFNNGGFTVVELMVTLAVAAILFGFALPAFNELMSQRAMTARVNEFVLAVNYARSEAAKLGGVVSVQSMDDSDNGNDDYGNNGNGNSSDDGDNKGNGSDANDSDTDESEPDNDNQTRPRRRAMTAPVPTIKTFFRMSNKVLAKAKGFGQKHLNPSSRSLWLKCRLTTRA